MQFWPASWDMREFYASVMLILTRVLWMDSKHCTRACFPCILRGKSAHTQSHFDVSSVFSLDHRRKDTAAKIFLHVLCTNCPLLRSIATTLSPTTRVHATWDNPAQISECLRHILVLKPHSRKKCLVLLHCKAHVCWEDSLCCKVRTPALSKKPQQCLGTPRAKHGSWTLSLSRGHGWNSYLFCVLVFLSLWRLYRSQAPVPLRNTRRPPQRPDQIAVPFISSTLAQGLQKQRCEDSNKRLRTVRRTDAFAKSPQRLRDLQRVAMLRTECRKGSSTATSVRVRMFSRC